MFAWFPCYWDLYFKQVWGVFFSECSFFKGGWGPFHNEATRLVTYTFNKLKLQVPRINYSIMKRVPAVITNIFELALICFFSPNDKRQKLISRLEVFGERNLISKGMVKWQLILKIIKTLPQYCPGKDKVLAIMTGDIVQLKRQQFQYLAWVQLPLILEFCGRLYSSYKYRKLYFISNTWHLSINALHNDKIFKRLISWKFTWTFCTKSS